MADAEVDRPGAALRDVPFPAGLTDLRTRRLLRVNEQVLTAVARDLHREDPSAVVLDDTPPRLAP